MMKLMWSMLAVTSLLTAQTLAAPPLEIDFDTANLQDILTADTSDRAQYESSGDSRVMVLADSSVRFQQATVEPATKYTLSLEAEFEGDAESLEENPRFNVFTQLRKTSSRLPSREIQFFDSAGKLVGSTLRYALPFKNRHTYEDVFYTPRNAASVQINIASGKGIRLLLTQLRLEATADEGALNVNPAFRLGSHNYSGWANISAGGQLIEREGKTILDTKYGSTGQTIPLPSRGTYAISTLATGNGYNSVVKIRLYDAQGEKLMEVSTRRYGPPTYFVPPKEAVSASFLIYSCLLEEVRLFRAGDAQAIESLRQP